MSGDTVIGKRYEIEKRIGEGGMGEVFRSLDTHNGDIVAVKALKASAATPELISRFQREGEALRQLNHPNIVKMLATLQEGDQHYIVMEYVSGGSLRDLIESGGKLPIERVLKIALELSDALTRAHLLEIVHRDIKPANILLAEDGTPRLTDFGIAHLGKAQRMTNSGMLMGTVEYLSPEAIGGETLDQRADIWSFGVLLYEMLTEELPFQGDSFGAILNAILHQAPPKLNQKRSDIPGDLADLIEHMLEKDRANRISSVRQVGAALEAILRGEKPPTTTKRPAPILNTPSTIEIAQHNLPAQSTPFVGRAEELEDIADLLGKVRLVTLQAPGGMGKTRLALEAAADQVGNFQHGVFFVALAPVTSPELIPNAIAEAVKFDFYSSEPPQVQLMDFLREKEMLLVLDNFEHLVSKAGSVAEILEAAPRIKILVTSRERLNLYGENLLHLSGMSFPDYLTPEEMETFGAVQLFLQSARRAKPDFTLSEENRTPIAQICQRVFGMPLGIELAAAWVEILTLEEIVLEIERSLDFLETELRDVPERQRSLRAVFDYSWNLLTDEEQTSFAKLSIFRGGFTRDAAQQVADASLRALSALVNKSLLQHLPTGRYEVHELLRQYAADKLNSLPEMQHSTCQRHCQYFLNFLKHTDDIWSIKYLEIMQGIDAELENVRCAITWNLENPDIETLEQIIPTLTVYYEVRCLYQEGLNVFRKLSETFKGKHAYLYAAGLIRQGGILLRMSRFEEAQTLLQDGVRIAEEINDQTELANGISWLCYAAMQEGRYEDAKRLGKESTELARGADSRANLVMIMGNYAYVFKLTGEYEIARKLTQEILDLSAQQHNQLSLAYSYNNLGEVLRELGEYTEAFRLFNESNRLFSEIGYIRGVSFSLNNIAGTAPFLGNFDDAETIYNKSYRLAKQIGDRVNMGHSLGMLGTMKYYTGKFEEAKTIFEDNLVLRRQIGDPRTTSDSLVDLGNVAVRLHENTQAQRYYEEALGLRQQIGGQTGIGDAYLGLGDAALAREDFAEAKRFYQQALQQIANVDNLTISGRFVISLASANVELGLYEEAYQGMLPLRDGSANLELRWGVSWGFCVAGLAEIGLGRHSEGKADLLEGLRIAVETGFPPMLGFSTACNASVLLQEGDLENALRLTLVLQSAPNNLLNVLTSVYLKRLLPPLQKALPDTVFARIQTEVQNRSIQEIAAEWLQSQKVKLTTER